MELCRTGGQSLVVILIAKRMGRQQPNTLHQLWSMSNVEVSGGGLQVIMVCNQLVRMHDHT